ncbi:MAG: metallophosphoesterase, partial [Armatimonadota bacterium]
HLQASPADLVVNTGDVSLNGADLEADLEAARRMHEEMGLPFLAVPGNHDVGGKLLPGAPGPMTPDRVQRYEDAFGASFWRRDIGNARILGLNSLLMGTGFARENDQWMFLEQELARPATMPTIVVSHQPLFLENADEPGGDYWNVEPAPRARLLDLLARGGVRAVLSGHIHRPLRHTVGDILFVTTPPVSFGLPFGEQPEGWALVTVPHGDAATEATVFALGEKVY